MSEELQHGWHGQNIEYACCTVVSGNFDFCTRMKEKAKAAVYSHMHALPEKHWLIFKRIFSQTKCTATCQHADPKWPKTSSAPYYIIGRNEITRLHHLNEIRRVPTTAPLSPQDYRERTLVLMPPARNKTIHCWTRALIKRAKNSRVDAFWLQSIWNGSAEV